MERHGQQHEVSRAAGGERSDAVAEGRRRGAVLGRHAQDLARRSAHRHPCRDAVQPEHETHLLEHVAVVVDAGLVEPERDAGCPRRGSG